jgi:copper(I)-binding protein
MKISLVTLIILLGLAGPVRLPADAWLAVRDPWIREAPPTAKVLAAYMIIENQGDRDAEITAITSPDFGHTELHQTLVEDGIARMKPVEKLTIPAAGSVSLEPGGMHLMLFDPGRVLRAGDTVVLEIQPRDGNRLKSAVPVIRNGAGEDPHHHHQH